MPLIAVSGVDGSGKSTQIKLLTDVLAADGQTVAIRWFRPGYSPQAGRLKRALRVPSASTEVATNASKSQVAKRNSAMQRPGIRLAWLLFASVDSLIELGAIARLMRRSRTVIYDRWALDAVLDLRVNFADWPRVVSAVEKVLDAVSCPADHAVLLLVSPEISEHRLSGKHEPFPDTEDVARRRRVYYEEYAAQHPSLVVNGAESTEVVNKTICRRLGVSLNK